MTTDETSTIDEPSKRLTEMILKGEDQESARIAAEIVGGRSETNDIVDAISETMNIVADLHEVERYTVQQVESCERAAESALNAIRPGIKVEQRRISGKVMVTSLHGDPHRFDKFFLLRASIRFLVPLTLQRSSPDTTVEEKAAESWDTTNLTE